MNRLVEIESCEECKHYDKDRYSRSYQMCDKLQKQFSLDSIDHFHPDCPLETVEETIFPIIDDYSSKDLWMEQDEDE